MKNTLNFEPRLAESQLRYRIEIAEKRLQSFPLDKLDFILVDMEHPEGRERHAHQCHTDLSGRTIEFLSSAHSVLEKKDDYWLDSIVGRIILKKPSRLMLRRMMVYYKYSNNYEAYRYIELVCEEMFALLDSCTSDEEYVEKRNKEITDGIMERCPCDIEPIVFMYEMTGNEKYLKLARLEAKVMKISVDKAHSHSELTVMRSLQKAAIVTGDESWVENVNKCRKEIIDRQMPYADGSIPEGFPKSFRTEGCSIADWIMLNLQYGRMYDDAEAYDMAEHSLWNAMFFNQYVTGGFGHRDYAYRGYTTSLEEAWWCCTQTCGLAMCEFARHAVQLVDGNIKVNYLIPGTFTLKANGHDIRVTITTLFPEKFDAVIRVEGASDLDLTVRIPYYVKHGNVTKRNATDGSVYYNVSGRLGHYVEPREDGYSFKYGPLLLASMLANWLQTPPKVDIDTSNAPEGYIREAVVANKSYAILDKPDEDGFFDICAKGHNPTWLCFDDGNGSHFGTHNVAPAYIELLLADGKKEKLFLQPMMYQTSALILNNVATVFDVKIKE